MTRAINCMNFELSDEQRAIEDAMVRLCQEFDDDYWSGKDARAEFPHEFHAAVAEGGWLGITMPKAHGGGGLGMSEAAVMMRAIAAGGGGGAAMSAIHINLFAPQPLVGFASDAQKARLLPGLINGSQKSCFGVTEADAGLNTTHIKTFAKRVDGGYVVNGSKLWTSTAQVADKILLLTRTTPLEHCERPTQGMTLFFTEFDRDSIEVRLIHKLGRAAVDSNAIFIEDFFIAEQDRIGEEGKGFGYLLEGLNAERVIVAAGAVGLAKDALRRAANYAAERVVFGRPIGQNQSIQHPLAENWCAAEAAWLMTMKAASLFDNRRACGLEANAAKFLAGKVAFDAATQSLMTHGGMGYAREYQVERLFRESILQRIAPVSEQLVLSFIAEKALGLPKSY